MKKKIQRLRPIAPTALHTHRTYRSIMAKLHRRAQTRLSQRDQGEVPDAENALSTADTRKLLHELEVHQVELELQNAELQETQDRLEDALVNYVNLYDFAPIGYFSLDKEGRIHEVNLVGAALLGVERSRLINRLITGFVAPSGRDIVTTFLGKMFALSGSHACEVQLHKPDKTNFWADFRGTSAFFSCGSVQCCRVAVYDITLLREAEEVRHRLEAVTTANQVLREEIARREAAEEALRKSEIHLGKMLEQSDQMRSQLRRLSHEILRSQEEERKRISRELHDEIAQTLVGINVALHNLTQESVGNASEFRRKITRTQRQVEKSVAIVQRFARDLRPPTLDHLGLNATLEAGIKEFTKRIGAPIRFTTFAGVDKLNASRCVVVYRVVHSALTNVARHAQATQVRVTLRKLKSTVLLTIVDNGKAFDLTKVLNAKGKKHLGLIGMRERVEMVGGSFHIDSTPDRGTRIQARIPLHDAPPD